MKAPSAEFVICGLTFFAIGAMSMDSWHNATKPAPTDGRGVPEVIEEPAPVVEPVPEPAKPDPEPVVEPAPVVPAPAPPKPVVAPAAPTKQSGPSAGGAGGARPQEYVRPRLFPRLFRR